MKLLKVKLLVVAAMMFAATSAFASYSNDYSADITVNTASLAGQTGYIYLQYLAGGDAPVSSAATVAFTTDGTLGSQVTGAAYGLMGGSTGTTLAQSPIGFTASTDFEQAVTFGTTMDFTVGLASNPTTVAGGVNTLSLSFFADPYGLTALLNTSGINNSAAGEVADINLNNDGTGSAQSLDASTTATPTPIPGALYLLGSGLMGLVGMRRKKQN